MDFLVKTPKEHPFGNSLAKALFFVALGFLLISIAWYFSTGGENLFALAYNHFFPPAKEALISFETGGANF